MPSRVVAIINPGAGKRDARELANNLTQRFESAGLTAEIILAGNGLKIIEAARRAVKTRPTAVVAGGGDGSINAVASALVDTRIPLGILPLGTLNHFAKDLHIPLELEEATRNIIAGQVVSIDVGQVNDQIILNNSSLGLYPSIVRLRDQQQEQLSRGKWPAFVWATLTVLHRYPFLSVRLSIDGKELARRTPFVFIGNNQYDMESLNIGSRECLDAGQLSLYMPHASGRLGLLRLGFRALIGRLGQAKDFDALCAKEIWIETRRQHLHVAIDGEVMIMNTPLHYRVRPGALRVIVPETHESTEHAHARPSL